MLFQDLFKNGSIPFYEKSFVKNEFVLQQGDISQRLYLIRKGALRMGHVTPDGKDVSTQFFFEGDHIASIASFYDQTPSEFFIQALEETNVVYVERKDFFHHLEKNPDSKELLLEFLMRKMLIYNDLFLSRIRYSPAERYQELVTRHGELLDCVPDQYLASYLGMTPVSFSRIKNRLS